ncbi:MAG: hypothetical protein DRJ69_06750, partial [Thermoprotei archaeon]
MEDWLMPAEEQEFTERVEGCNVVCAPEEGCTTRCVYSVWETVYAGMAEVEALSEYDDRPVAKAPYRGSEEAVEQAEKLSLEEGVPVTLDLPEGRVVVRDGHVLGMIPRGGDAGKCRIIGSHRVLRIPKYRWSGQRGDVEEHLTVCVSERALNRWRERHSGDLEPTELVEHPAAQTVFAVCRRYLGRRGVSKGYDKWGIKGAVYEVTGEPYINLVWQETNRFAVALATEQAGSVAEEEILTALHEYAHYLDDVNGRPYEGSWGGSNLMQAFAAALGMPMAAGSEAEA